MNRFFFGLCVLWCAAPLAAHAATLSLAANPQHIGVGDAVEVSVSVDSKDSVNAFAGRLTYPKQLVPLGVNDGDSIISLWIEHPQASNLSFAGIVPGGFAGKGGLLFKVVFKAMVAGSVKVSLDQSDLRRNDGQGTQEPVTITPLTLQISARPSGGFSAPPDTAPPEPFPIYEGADASFFGGRPYLVFSAVDKGSGISHYEICESRWWGCSAWSIASSPYLIKDAYLTSDIYVKALDRAGNARISEFYRRHWLRPYEMIILGSVLLLISAGFFFVRRRIIL